MHTIQDVIDKVRILKQEKPLILVAIDGRGGSGKTTHALLIKHALPEAEIITTDDFLNTEIHKIDETEVERQILKPLSEGKSATYMEYDGKNRQKRTVLPEGIVIIEGIYSNHSSLQDYYDVTVWVEAEDIKDRVEMRDGHYDPDWEKYHRPNEDTYISEDKPQERADFVIRNAEDEKLEDLGQLWEEFTG